MTSTRVHHEQVASTQELARAAARAGSPVGSYFVADEQTDGRGQERRSWSSPPGGLYLSYIGPDLAEAGAFVSFALAAGLADALRARWAPDLLIRWPNDLVLPPMPERKIGGILPERIQAPDGGRTVVGIGLNVAAPLAYFPEPLRGDIVSLAELATPVPDLADVEAVVVDRIGEVLRDLGTPSGRVRWLAVGRKLLYGRGCPVRLDGEPVGRLAEVGADGALLIEGAQGLTEHRSGRLRVEATA